MKGTACCIHLGATNQLWPSLAFKTIRSVVFQWKEFPIPDKTCIKLLRVYEMKMTGKKLSSFYMEGKRVPFYFSLSSFSVRYPPCFPSLFFRRLFFSFFDRTDGRTDERTIKRRASIPGTGGRKKQRGKKEKTSKKKFLCRFEISVGCFSELGIS